jgi:membrane peptidoglycan carboxypeptidase
MSYPSHADQLTTRAARGGLWRWLLAGLALVATCLYAVTWIATPDTGDLLARVASLDAAHHTVPLRPGEVPRQLAEALVATEDSSFYQDHGVNVEGLLRSAGYDLIHLCECQGGSTITEELADDIYMGGTDHSIWGRWWDIILALKIEDHLSKTQVLDAFLSEVYLGDGAVGALQASQVYFHRPLNQDTLSEVALLAGLPQSPSLLDPLTHPAAARARREEVLELMQQDGYISRAQARLAGQQPLLPG